MVFLKALIDRHCRSNAQYTLLPTDKTAPEKDTQSLHGQSRSRASASLYLVIVTIFLIAVLMLHLCTGLPVKSLAAHGPTEWVGGLRKSQKARLHVVAPTTSSNLDLCRMLVSSYALGYPTPIFINWAVKEDPDPEVQMLRRVPAVLEYIQKLKHLDDYQNDLVLFIDTWDLWFQLGPDVLLKGYFETTSRLDRDSRRTFGDGLVQDHDMRHTVIFGPDRLCWPADPREPQCWAATKTPLDDGAFGPHRPMDLVREPWYDQPRWLNAGTMMGPIEDIERILTRTQDIIVKNYTTNSDQYYLGGLYGAQETSRLSQQGSLPNFEDEEIAKLARVFEPSEGSAELHIGIDHLSAVVQTVGFYKNALDFVQPSLLGLTPGATDDESTLQSYYQQQVSVDIQKSSRPFEALIGSPKRETEWSSVPLLRNRITGTIPPLIHFTSAKPERDQWWPRTWFWSDAAALRAAAVAKGAGPRSLSDDIIAGRKWYAGNPDDTLGTGAWSGQNEWVPWDKLCGAHETVLFPQT